jgi:hypothetical protein
MLGSFADKHVTVAPQLMGVLMEVLTGVLMGVLMRHYGPASRSYAGL